MIQVSAFKISSSTKVFIHIINNQKFLVSSNLLNKKYLYVPNFVRFSKEKFHFIFESKAKKLALFTKFVERFRIWSSERPVTKKLTLKGLGYKALLLDNKSVLSLKLGLSHSIKIPIKLDEMRLKINKKTITMKGFSATNVGNFAEKICRLKLPDSYKGKGIWYKNRDKVLKVLKKR
jgi:hypothetical protein